MEVHRYDSSLKADWDLFIHNSKNGTFLFCRDYMEYHCDRFEDHSLMFREGGRLAAVMPANACGGTLVSHGGLTYGGIVSDGKMRVGTMMEVFRELLAYAEANRFSHILYKCIPHIYHCTPAEEDLYALFRVGATLVRRDASSSVFMAELPKFSKGRKWCVSKARKAGITVAKSSDLERFMDIETECLQSKYGTSPVHSSREIRMLAERFPENIKLFAATLDGTMLGGTIIYESDRVAHAQYIAATETGKEQGALDLVMDYLLRDYYATKPVFDFGISTEQSGRYLNQGLVANKESFGGRTVAYDFYDIPVLPSGHHGQGCEA